MIRMLREDKLIETAERLVKRIDERFPKSGLSQVAAEVLQIIREAVVRAESIRRPNVWLRAGLALLFVLAVTGVVVHLQSRADQVALHDRVLQFLDATKGAAAYLVGAAIFLVTLEVRFKRRKALKAIHELRAMAHIIDMHQLTKDPDRVGLKVGAVAVSGKPMNADAIGRYLHYCTELLALISKIGQLYVQDFPDATALAAADHFENLASNLSHKMWQKLMILDRMLTGDAEPGQAKAAPGSAPDADDIRN